MCVGRRGREGDEQRGEEGGRGEKWEGRRREERGEEIGKSRC